MTTNDVGGTNVKFYWERSINIKFQRLLREEIKFPTANELWANQSYIPVKEHIATPKSSDRRKYQLKTNNTFKYQLSLHLNLETTPL